VIVEDEQQSRTGRFRQGTDSGSGRVASPSLHAGSSSRLRLMILAPFALFLFWEVITRSLAGYFADATPDIALRLRSTNPIALVNLAQGKLNLERGNPPGLLRDDTMQETYVAKGFQSSPNAELGVGSQPSSADAPQPTSTEAQEAAQIRSLAELALLNDPLNARAFSILGHLSQRTSDLGRTRTLMEAAARRSLLESTAVDWMMRKSYEDGDYHSAIRYADVLLKTRHQAPGLALPVLGRMTENPDAKAQLKQLLASEPPWRGQFFESLPANVSDARSPLDILLSLKDTAKPPTTAELRPYLQFLIGHGFYELAYYTWLQFLPPEELSKAGYLFNGDFEFARSGLPFDWNFTGKSGVTIQIADRFDSNGGRALLLEFGPGRVDVFGVSQLVVLPPGNYRFLGRRQVNTVSQRGLQWRVTCASKARTVIGESPTITEASVWEDFEFSFTIPNTDCSAQYVGLMLDANLASERFISGSIWYDDLRIVRESAPER
jgi:hypothetical protein